MKPSELKEFLQDNNLSNKDFASIVGVTPGAVNHWTEGRRDIPEWAVRLVKMFIEDPDSMDEFEAFGDM